MLPGHPLHPAHQLADVKRRNHAQHAADQGADNTDHRTLHHKDGHDLARRGTNGAQDRDISALVVHHHDQRGDDIESSHGHDHQQQQANHGFFHFHGAEQTALGVGPVVSLVTIPQAGSYLLRHLRCGVQILDRQAHALHLVRLPVLNGGRIGHMDQAHGAIQLGPDLEDAHHIQTLQARGNPPRCSAGLGHDQGNLVTHIQPETPRDNIAQHHAILVGLKVLQAALHNMLGHDRDLAFLLRINTADLDRLHRAFIGQHAVQLGKRHGCRHLGVFHRGSGHRTPVIDGLDANDGRVGHHAEDAVTHFTLETVHHRQHHNHRQHAQGEADHRGHGDKRNKTIAALGAGIARADKNR